MPKYWNMDEQVAAQPTSYRYIDGKRVHGNCTYKGEEDDKLAYEVMANGGTAAKCAAALGISVNMIYNWRKRLPSFKAAYEIGNAIGMAKFEDKADDKALYDKSFNAAVWQIQLNLRAGSHYKQSDSETDDAYKKIEDAAKVMEIMERISKETI